jgi:hypothetical protein
LNSLKASAIARVAQHLDFIRSFALFAEALRHQNTNVKSIPPGGIAENPDGACQAIETLTALLVSQRA